MAYAGMGLFAPATSGGSAATIRQVKLDKECELRIEVADTPFRLRVLNGTAEIFGTEIPPEIWLSFPPRHKFAVRNLINFITIMFLRQYITISIGTDGLMLARFNVSFSQLSVSDYV